MFSVIELATRHPVLRVERSRRQCDESDGSLGKVFQSLGEGSSSLRRPWSSQQQQRSRYAADVKSHAAAGEWPRARMHTQSTRSATQTQNNSPTLQRGVRRRRCRDVATTTAAVLLLCCCSCHILVQLGLLIVRPHPESDEPKETLALDYGTTKKVPINDFETNNIIPNLYEGYIVSVHRMVMENRPVDPGSIQGSHRPISFLRIKHRTRANDIMCKTEYK